MPTALASVPRETLPNGSVEKVGECVLRCHPGSTPISTTFWSGSMKLPSRRPPMSQRSVGAEKVRQGVNSAEDFMPEPPRPLMRELPPADPFPLDALGDVLAPAARAIHDRVQAPLAICGQSVLAAATLVVQAHADI